MGDLPHRYIWVIDDDSEDGTDEVIAEVMRGHDRISCVRRRRPDARTGKGGALNSAYAALDASLPAGADRHRVVVCIVDADAELALNTLAQVTGPGGFGDPKAGAVRIAVFMSNRGERCTREDRGRLGNLFARYLVRMQDLEFRTTIAAMQILRVRTGSVGMGGNGQFTRMSVLDDIGTQYGLPWHDALLEDYELGLRALLSGHQNRYVHDTHVAQEGLISMRRLLNQRTRWSQRCSSPSPRRCRRRSSAGSGRSWASGVLLGIAPFAIWGPIYRSKCEPDASWWKGPVWGIGLWIYVYYMYLAAIRAAARLILGFALGMLMMLKLAPGKRAGKQA